MVARLIGMRGRTPALPAVPRTLARLGAGTQYRIIAWPCNEQGMRHNLPGHEILAGLEPMLCELDATGSRIRCYAETSERLSDSMLSLWCLRRWAGEIRAVAQRSLTVWWVVADHTLQPNVRALAEMKSTQRAALLAAHRDTTEIVIVKFTDGSTHAVEISEIN